MSEITPVGRAIRHYRERKRWTVGQLAKYSGVTSGHISMVERGLRSGDFRRSTLVKLADALEVRVEDLTDFSPHKQKADKASAIAIVPERRDRLWQLLNALSDDELEGLELFVERLLNRGKAESG